MGGSQSVSRAAQPAPARLFFERDTAGWNNVRITFESLVCVARVLERELVLPPPSAIEHLSTPFHETRVYDVPSLREAVRFSLAAEASTEAELFPGTLDELLDAAGAGRTLPLDLRLSPERTRLTHFELLFAERAEAAEAAKAVLGLELATPYHDAAAAALTRAGLVPDEFHAVHLRRGDFARTRPNTQWSGEAVATHVRRAFPADEHHWPLLVACAIGAGEADDDPYPELVEELSSERRVIRSDALCNVEDGPLLRVLLDTLMLAKAKRFCGTPFSTFSTGVDHWRAVAAIKAGRPVPVACALGRPVGAPSPQDCHWQRSTTFGALLSRG